MKKLLILLLSVFVLGCASVEIPNYIQDDNPYKKTFIASYDETLEAVKAALDSSGWEVIREADPSTYEIGRKTEDETIQQVVLFTDVRQVGLFLGTRYARINIFLQSNKEESTDVELRYITANSVVFKTFYNYEHDKSVKRFFKSVEEKLTPQK